MVEGFARLSVGITTNLLKLATILADFKDSVKRYG
jgi:hypothetical protein